MTCTEFQALLPDYLEPHGLRSADRAAADAHVAGCAECAALVADLRTIVRDAGDLPALSPSRDLWSGVEARIEAPVVALPTRHTGENTVVVVEPVAAPAVAVRAPSWRRFAIAASVLVATTAGITYAITARGTGALAPQASVGTAPAATGTDVRNVSRPGATETFDREIAVLRKLMDDRRGDMDPMTVGIIEKNLKLIDRAIAESKAALAGDPGSSFLMERLTQAYDTKLQLLREVATRPPRT